jgi:uncharacterized protein YabN with tetrapyrrole methylase and pyrophosphatase domain
MSRGSLIVVGTGIRLIQQCTPEARDWIEASDVVYAAGGDPIVERWLETLNSKMISLHHLYCGDRSRDETYEAMTEAILDGVRSGKAVCAVFYGHPGVYVYPSHESIRRARADGFEARMLPGVSSEDCLYADLGLDPGRSGWQSYEATDFLINARKFDVSAGLLLWQVALVGDRTLRVFESDASRLRVLGEVLMRDYPADHLVIVYEAATLAITKPKVQSIPLDSLHRADVSQQSMLYVPPLLAPRECSERVALLDPRS